MMNPIIYAANSKEFKRAFGRILRCQWRRRPRSFVENQLSRSMATEMSKLTRLATIHRNDLSNRSGTRKSSGENGGKRSNSGPINSLSMLLQSVPPGKKLRLGGSCTVNERSQSPIASLRLLHKRQREDVKNCRNTGCSLTSPTSPISSDDEVTYIQHFDDECDVILSEDERFDSDQEMSPLMPRKTRSISHLSAGSHTSSGHSGGYSMIPHIVIDSYDETNEDPVMGPPPQTTQPVEPPSVQNNQIYNTTSRDNYTTHNEDNIMWL